MSGKKTQKTQRIKIPAAVRRAVWVNCNGKVFSTMCNCCRSVEIDVWNFHCGHITPVASGGTNAMSNLRTICAPCNLSMGKRNLTEFKSEYFEDDSMDIDFEIIEL